MPERWIYFTLYLSHNMKKAIPFLALLSSCNLFDSIKNDDADVLDVAKHAPAAPISYGAAPMSPVIADHGITFSAGVSPITITQTTPYTVDAGAGTAGTTLVVQAQNGGSTTAGSQNGGGGATAWIASGCGGSPGSGGAAGACGPVVLALADAGVVKVASTTSVIPVNPNVVALGTQASPFYDVGGASVSAYMDAGGTTQATARIGLTPIYYSPTASTISMPCMTLNTGVGSPSGTVAPGVAGDLMICDNSSEAYITDSSGHLGLDINVAASSVSIGLPTWQFQPFYNSQINENQAFIWTYPTSGSSGAANGVVGGNGTLSIAQPGTACSGSGHTCGAGGVFAVQFPAGGAGTSSATSGAVGAFQVQNPSGTIIESWGATHYLTSVTVTVATSGTTTLSAAQLQYANWITNAPTLVGATTIAFGNNKIDGWLNLSGLVFSGQTLTVSCGTGTDTRTSMTKPLMHVMCDGSNHIYTQGT